MSRKPHADALSRRMFMAVGTRIALFGAVCATIGTTIVAACGGDDNGNAIKDAGGSGSADATAMADAGVDGNNGNGYGYGYGYGCGYGSGYGYGYGYGCGP